MNTPRPQDDFFNYVNGKWIEENPIPPQESRWGSFYVLRVEVEKQLKDIFEKILIADPAVLDENAKKVRDFYATGMDIEKLNALKDTPLQELFDRVDAITDVDNLVETIGHLHREGISALWTSGVDQDIKQSDMMALYIGQSGLSLPDRDYYVVDNEKNLEIRKKYLAYTESVLDISQALATSKPSSKVLMDIETRLAKASMTRVELRDIEKQYNKMTPSELSAITPRINWEKYFAAAGAPIPEYMIVCQPEFMKEVNAMLEEVSLNDIKAYLRWHILNGVAGFLSEDFAEKVFDFYGRTFNGATEMKPKWRRTLSVVDSMLDEAVGQLYVKENFNDTAKAKIQTLVEHLTAAYRARIEKLPWMGAETKEKALAKLAVVTRKLGYPDKWKDFTALEIGTDSYVQNYFRAHRFESDRQMKKIGKPVDRTEWYMSPQTVNACYSPSMNEVLFPAAFLQPPFFDPNASDATNFGAIGTVIGHELSHGFDDQGALFDLNGNLQNWWTKEDKERFDKQSAHLAEQFDAYKPFSDLSVNGKLTLGENIADLGGLLIGYDGMILALGGSDGVTTEALQDFFTGYAIMERGYAREEALRTQIQTDPHAPSIYRVNGPLSNMVEFYNAFDVKPGDALYREENDRVSIW